MREILFRAWDKQRQEYLSGGELFIAIQPGKNPKNIQYLDALKNPDMYKDRFELEQFTGLCDKNGKKIFDGDVVHCYGNDTTGNSYDWKAIVEFGNPNAEYNWGFQLKPLTEFRHNTDILLWVEMQDYADICCEIIGTIHDKEG